MIRRTPLPRSKTPLKRKSWLKRGSKRVPQFNVKRIARKQKAYAKVIASNFHRELRYKAFVRSGGLCECADCRATDVLTRWIEQRWELVDRSPIPVWFVKGGGPAWKRFRSTHGELHHTSYKFFGDENPAELELVLWVWKDCHARIESLLGTRRRFLKSGKAA